jgi:hypothetical protein
VLSEVLSLSDAQTNAVSVTNATTNTRWDLPGIRQARFIRLWIRKADSLVIVHEFYPRRLVQSDDIEAESITALNIAASAITVDKLAAGAIDGFLITGATFRTAASGARLEMTSANGLRSLDASNNELLRLQGGQGLRFTAVEGARANTRAVTFWASNAERGGLYGYQSSGSSNVELVAWVPNESAQLGSTIELYAADLTGFGGAVVGDIVHRALRGHTFFIGYGGDLRMRINTDEPAYLRRAQTGQGISEVLRVWRENALSNDQGAEIVMALDTTSSSVATRDLPAATIRTTWANATHEGRTARLTLLAHDAGSAREGMRIQASGSVPQIGFYGVNAVSRQLIAAAASSTATTQTLANSIRTILINLGLVQA